MIGCWSPSQAMVVQVSVRCEWHIGIRQLRVSIDIHFRQAIVVVLLQNYHSSFNYMVINVMYLDLCSCTVCVLWVCSVQSLQSSTNFLLFLIIIVTLKFHSDCLMKAVSESLRGCGSGLGLGFQVLGLGLDLELEDLGFGNCSWLWP